VCSSDLKFNSEKFMLYNKFARLAFLFALSSTNVLLAAPNNNYGGAGVTDPSSAAGLAGSSFSATAVVSSTNSLTVGNDIAWTGLMQGTLQSDTESSTTQLTSVVSGSATAGQRVLITGATSADHIFGSSDYFVLHGSGSNTINFVIVSDQNAAGTAGDTVFSPNQNLIDQTTASNDTAQRTIRGRIASGTTLVSDTYTCTLVLKNYSGS